MGGILQLRLQFVDGVLEGVLLLLELACLEVDLILQLFFLLRHTLPQLLL